MKLNFQFYRLFTGQVSNYKNQNIINFLIFIDPKFLFIIIMLYQPISCKNNTKSCFSINNMTTMTIYDLETPFAAPFNSRPIIWKKVYVDRCYRFRVMVDGRKSFFVPFMTILGTFWYFWKNLIFSIVKNDWSQRKKLKNL